MQCHISYTLKTLEQHADQVDVLLRQCDCEFSLTGSVLEKCGTDTVGWFISRSGLCDEIGIEATLRTLQIPYDVTQHGPEFRILKHHRFRLEDDLTPRTLQLPHGDNTLSLLEEIETAIAGNDYTLMRIFIQRKREQYLTHLGWASQLRTTEAVFAD